MEFFHINRTALVTRPTAELFKWANEVFPEQPLDPANMGRHDEGDVFLLPDFDTVEEVEAHIRANIAELLSVLLDGWSMDEKDWPQPLDWALFERFYNYHIETMVTDTLEDN